MSPGEHPTQLYCLVTLLGLYSAGPMVTATMRTVTSKMTAQQRHASSSYLLGIYSRPRTVLAFSTLC